MKNLKIQTNQITNQIHAGYLNKKGNMWTKKKDITQEALMAVTFFLDKGEFSIKENGVIYDLILKKREE